MRAKWYKCTLCCGHFEFEIVDEYQHFEHWRLNIDLVMCYEIVHGLNALNFEEFVHSPQLIPKFRHVIFKYSNVMCFALFIFSYNHILLLWMQMQADAFQSNHHERVMYCWIQFIFVTLRCMRCPAIVFCRLLAINWYYIETKLALRRVVCCCRVCVSTFKWATLEIENISAPIHSIGTTAAMRWYSSSSSIDVSEHVHAWNTYMHRPGPIQGADTVHHIYVGRRRWRVRL